MCADMVEVSWRDGYGKPRHATALLEDISPSGACVQLEIPLPLGIEVRMECQKKRFAGHVQYCAYREIGYFAGVEFQLGTKWSKQEYRPRHSLDLDKLMARSK